MFTQKIDQEFRPGSIFLSDTYYIGKLLQLLVAEQDKKYLLSNAAVSEENPSFTLLGMNIKSQYLCSKHINILKCQNLDKNLVYYHLHGIKNKQTTLTHTAYLRKLCYKAIMKCSLLMMQQPSKPNLQCSYVYCCN